VRRPYKTNHRLTIIVGERKKIYEWLFSESFAEKHRELVHKTVANTGKWFLREPTFLKWATENVENILYCPGIRILP